MSVKNSEENVTEQLLFVVVKLVLNSIFYKLLTGKVFIRLYCDKWFPLPVSCHVHSSACIYGTRSML